MVLFLISLSVQRKDITSCIVERNSELYNAHILLQSKVTISPSSKVRMSESKIPSDLLNNAEMIGADLTGVPEELRGSPNRQAVPSIHGTVYQAWCSIDAWLCLTNSDEVIYLEGAEDFDIVSQDSGIAVQIKHQSGSISLNYKKAQKALENFWEIACNDSTHQVQTHYLTTNSVAKENDSEFDGMCGLDAWRSARTNPEMAGKLAKYLEGKLDSGSSLREFLHTATQESVQEQLINRFHWFTNQPDLEVVKRSVDNRITVLLNSQQRSISHTPQVRKYIESRFWELLLEKDSAKRCLTFGELLHQIEYATTTTFSIPLDKLPELIGQWNPGLSLLNLLLDKTPKPPEPLLLRHVLTQQLEELIKQRRVVLLTGTVHKGKTTIAQLVASTICPSAWWVNLTEQKPGQVDILFMALASRIEQGDCPSLIIIDDLDISPSAHRVYRDSLALVLHRAKVSGRGVLLTARGTSSEAARLEDFKNVEILDIPELSYDEVQKLCLEHGCSNELVNTWSNIVLLWTKGHPKLVQVHLDELSTRGWPNPNANDLLEQSSAVESERQMARRYLSQSVPSHIAEFVYTVSESSIPIDRTIAIKLAESIEGLNNAGDVIDNLVGKWLEMLEGKWLRATSLLQGVAKEIWSVDKLKIAHIRLHDAIIAKQTLSPTEAAALLFHSFIADDPQRLALNAMRFQMVENEEAEREIQKQVLWLTYVALEPGQSIINEPLAAACLRSLQFRVASTINDDSLPKICERWSEEVDKITHVEIKEASQTMMWLSIGIAQNPKVPLKPRLDAVMGFSQLEGEQREFMNECEKRFFELDDVIKDIPSNGTTNQMILLCATQCVKDMESLSELIQWLDEVATDDIRQEFDSMLEWPLVQNCGAFVQGAWAANHEETKNWDNWLPLLESLKEYSKRRKSPRLGREAAKAQAIILTEFLENGKEALKILDQAEISFGHSIILREQRANVLFQTQDDKNVLQIWNEISVDEKNNLDPFAYRRVAISASRLEKWNEAEQIFRDAADSIKPGEFEVTKFGLKVDAAYAASLGGSQSSAVKLLKEAVLELPEEARIDDEGKWDSTQRFVVEVCRHIDRSLWRPEEIEQRIEPGSASSPALKDLKIEPGQEARSEMTLVQILKLTAMLSIDLQNLSHELDALATSKYFIVRFNVAEARLSMSIGSGAGKGFIEALLNYDKEVYGLSLYIERGQDILKPDEVGKMEVQPAPERWPSLLYAGIICAGNNLIPNIGIWLDACQQNLEQDSLLFQNIELLLEGATLPHQELDNAISNITNSPHLRCGAAVRLLMEQLPPERAIVIQGFLATGAIPEDNWLYQSLFNIHIAKSFSNVWQSYSQKPFLLSSPRTSIPSLLSAIKDVNDGNGTLRTLFSAAELAAGRSIGKYSTLVR